jgi:hypothetical protein
MAIFYGIGNALVGNDELRDKAAEGTLRDFQNLIKSRSKDAKMEFMFGTATAENIRRSTTDDAGGTIGFEPIGIGKPLTSSCGTSIREIGLTVFGVTKICWSLLQ